MILFAKQKQKHKHTEQMGEGGWDKLGDWG